MATTMEHENFFEAHQKERFSNEQAEKSRFDLSNYRELGCKSEIDLEKEVSKICTQDMVPIGMLRRLQNIRFFDRIEIIIDDSGSMNTVIEFVLYIMFLTSHIGANLGRL